MSKTVMFWWHNFIWQITLETHCKDADASAKPIVIAAHHNNVLNSSVWPLVAKEVFFMIFFLLFQIDFETIF